MAFKYFEKDAKDAIPLKRGPLKLEETVKWSFAVLMDSAIQPLQVQL